MVANMWLNETTEVVQDIKCHHPEQVHSLSH